MPFIPGFLRGRRGNYSTPQEPKTIGVEMGIVLVTADGLESPPYFFWANWNYSASGKVVVRGKEYPLQRNVGIPVDLDPRAPEVTLVLTDGNGGVFRKTRLYDPDSPDHLKDA